MNKEQYLAFANTSIEDIQRAHDENYLSIFAGAGVSVNSGLPSWNKLIAKFKRLLYRNRKIKRQRINEPPLLVAEKFFCKFGNDNYHKILKLLLPNNVEPNKLHRAIIETNIRNLITTNWDNLFEEVIIEQESFFNIIKCDEDIGNSTGFAKLIKMHGSLDVGNIVFKESDYLQYSQNFPLIENYIKGVFSTDMIVMIGYSLGDPNVKQIISWINFYSNNSKPIYWIKTNTSFDGEEFTFYKSKKIYILYTQEIFGKKKHLQESLDFIQKIKELPQESLIEGGDISSSSEKIMEMLFNFDYLAMEERINEISKRNSTVSEDLEKAFLLYQCGQDVQSYKTLKDTSKKAFREKEYRVWFVSLYNMCNMVLRGSINIERLQEIQTYHRERMQIDLHESYFKLSSSCRLQVKDLREMDNFILRKTEHVRELKEKILKEYEKWSPANFNNYPSELDKLSIEIISRIFRFLILTDARVFYQQIVESLLPLIVIASRNHQIINGKDIFEVKMNNLYFYGILKYESNDNRDIQLLLDRYFNNANIIIQMDEKVDLAKIFENICSKFLVFDMLVTEYNLLFGNFLSFVAWVKIDQKTFDVIIKLCCEKIKNNLSWIDGYCKIDYFVTKQYQRNRREIDFNVLQEIILSFINQSMSVWHGNKDILIHTRCIQNLLDILQKRASPVDKNLSDKIFDFIEHVHGTNNVNYQIEIAHLFICELYLFVQGQDELQGKIKDFLKETWRDGEKQNAIRTDYELLRLTRRMWQVEILEKEKYYEFYSKLKKKYDNLKIISNTTFAQFGWPNFKSNLISLLQECEKDFSDTDKNNDHT